MYVRIGSSPAMCGQFWSHAFTHARYLVGSDGSHVLMHSAFEPPGHAGGGGGAPGPEVEPISP